MCTTIPPAGTRPLRTAGALQTSGSESWPGGQAAVRTVIPNATGLRLQRLQRRLVTDERTSLRPPPIVKP